MDYDDNTITLKTIDAQSKKFGNERLKMNLSGLKSDLRSIQKIEARLGFDT